MVLASFAFVLTRSRHHSLKTFISKNLTEKGLPTTNYFYKNKKLLYTMPTPNQQNDTECEHLFTSSILRRNAGVRATRVIFITLPAESRDLN